MNDCQNAVVIVVVMMVVVAVATAAAVFVGRYVYMGLNVL